MKLWQRYLWKQLLQTFCFFLLCFSLLYCFVDFSMHGIKFLEKTQYHTHALINEYIKRLSVHLNFFFSLSFLFTFLKVILDLKNHRELIALQMAGISLIQIVMPWIYFAFILCGASYANYEWGYADIPSMKKHTKASIVSMSLPDESELVYKIKEERLFDVFWIKSPDNFWSFQSLDWKSDPPLGFFADHFERTNLGELKKTESYEVMNLPSFLFEDLHPAAMVPIENRCLSELAKEAFTIGAQAPRAAAYFYYKLASALIPLCMIGWLCPFIFNFSRGKSSLILMIGSLFTYISFITLLDSLLILSENQVCSPLLAMSMPIILSLCFFIKFLCIVA